MLLEFRVVRRRAVLCALLRAGRAMRPRDVVETLRSAGHEFPGYPEKVVAEVLRSQVRVGCVERLARGWYQVLPAQIPRSTMRRILDWEWIADHWFEEQVIRDRRERCLVRDSPWA